MRDAFSLKRAVLTKNSIRREYPEHWHPGGVPSCKEERMEKAIVKRVIGPVVDVHFPYGKLPEL